METDLADDLDARLAVRLRDLRAQHGLSLDALAERAGVSRSMISLVERGESSPTAATLHRLAAGLGVTMHDLFADTVQQDASPLAVRARQPLWRDPDTGYTRRELSPPGFDTPLHLLEVVLPSGARVAYDAVAPVQQQLWVVEGQVQVRMERTVHKLARGDCLAMRSTANSFHNPGDKPARYLIAAVKAGVR